MLRRNTLANQEHLDMLKQGVKTWNQWRKANENIIPDLSIADLSGASFNADNLINTDLSFAELININLSLTDLTSANLSFISPPLHHLISTKKSCIA